MYTPKDSLKESLEHYRELISFYENQIKLFENKLKGDLSDTRRKCYEGLLEVSKFELKKCRQERNNLLIGKD